MDPLIFFLCYKATEGWPTETRKPLLIAVAIWIFLFAKTVKLMGHFIRYPGDIVLLPVSIMFGYVHGILKLIGLFTLSEVRDAKKTHGWLRRTDRATDCLGQP